MEPHPTAFIDPRARNAGLTVLKLVLLLAATFCGIWWWNRFWGIPGAGVLLWISLALGNLNRLQNAKIYRQFLPPGFEGEVGVDYLTFESEPAESYQNFRLLAEDAGCIFPVGRDYHIVTLRHRWEVPMSELRAKPIKAGLVWGVHIAFTPRAIPLPVAFVAAIHYYGEDPKKASGEPRSRWACEVLESWKKRAES